MGGPGCAIIAGIEKIIRWPARTRKVKKKSGKILHNFQTIRPIILTLFIKTFNRSIKMQLDLSALINFN